MEYYYVWFCLLGWEYFKIRLREVVKDCKKKQVMLWESHWTVLRFYTKEIVQKLMQILNDPTHPMRHYFDSRRSNRSGRFLLLRTNTNHDKVLFLPSALSVFNKNYTSH